MTKIGSQNIAIQKKAVPCPSFGMKIVRCPSSYVVHMPKTALDQIPGSCLNPTGFLVKGLIEQNILSSVEPLLETCLTQSSHNHL